MIIDIHSHTFPEAIAGKALEKLSKTSDLRYYLDGTLNDIKKSIRAAGIDYTVLLPVATSPKQHESINKTAIAINEETENTGILSFGGIHPANEGYKEIINNLHANGVKGIKVHPVFQEVNFDDISYKRIISYATEKDMAVMVHAGYDISYPGQDYATPDRILSVIEDVAPTRLILAHMGGWDCWDDVERLLVGRDVFFDTSFSISSALNKEGKTSCMAKQLSTRQFVRIIKNHGADKVMFGTDSPWTDQKEELLLIKNTGLSDDELTLILGENAKKFLGL